MKSPQRLAGKISLGHSLGYSDLPMGKSEASLGSWPAPRDFPQASASGNPLEQLCFLGRLQTCIVHYLLGIGLGGSYQAQQVPVWNKTIYFEQGLRGRCFP